MTTTTVHLLRHGEVHNPGGVLYGRMDGYHLSDLGREMEVIADMTRSRLLGWTGWVSTERALLGLVDRYRAERLVP